MVKRIELQDLKKIVYRTVKKNFNDSDFFELTLRYIIRTNFINKWGYNFFTWNINGDFQTIIWEIQYALHIPIWPEGLKCRAKFRQILLGLTPWLSLKANKGATLWKLTSKQSKGQPCLAYIRPCFVLIL